jgi:uncharacterized lipoprotein YddW (UPF0748 family)
MKLSYESILFLFILVVKCSLFSQTYTTKITSINPDPNQYPGGRGPDELVIYNPEYTSPKTGTNQYGIEIIVQNGRVTSIGGNNSDIPRDGFVVSGHGSGNKWLAENSKVGAIVVIEKNQIKITIDLECLRKNAQYKIDKTQRNYAFWSSYKNDFDSKPIEKRIADFQKLTSEIDFYYNEGDSLSVVKGLKKVDSILKEILFLTSESPSIEARGVWYRPIEKSKEEIIKTLDKIEKANFNLLFVETIWNGETIYPGKITQQKRQFMHFDPLKIFIEEGAKRGIEVHAWIHTFFVGYVGKTDLYDIGPVLKKHPEWAIKKRDGSKVSKAEDGYLYVCPAKPEVQDFLASLYKEITTKYPKIGGIQLDYIRYPENQSPDESYCYCDFCRSEFLRLYGVDPTTITPEKNPEQWEKWNQWRESNITRFVERIRKENKSSILSADIFPDTTISKKTKMQDWLLWVKNNYIDVIAPMAYTTESKWLDDQIKNMKKIIYNNYRIYCGIAPFLNLDPESLYDQIQTIRENSIGGMVMFSLGYLSDEILYLLKLGPFREKSLIPHKIKAKYD